MSAPFYRAFEDRYRGSRDLIKTRLGAYLPFLDPLKKLYPELSALDMGCGRGEWLEMLCELGSQARGVDLDDGMLEACASVGLPAYKGEALSALRDLPDSSLALVSGFHIAEHLPFDVLQQITAEALRVLQPGGLLILETPNAENLAVGTNLFYLDPTHERPIPHLLLSFLVEHNGFAHTKLLRLQETEGLRDTAQVQLIDVIAGASPDYAIIAQKAAPEEDLALFHTAFEHEYGLSINTLAQRYDAQLNSTWHALEQRMNVVDEQSRKMSQTLDHTVSRISEFPSLMESMLQNRELTSELQQVRAQLDIAMANANQWHLQNKVLENSLSWRITYPLRLGSRALRNPIQVGERITKAVARRLLTPAMRLALGHTGLRQALASKLRKNPKLFERLRQFAEHRGLVSPAPNNTPVGKPRNLAAVDLSNMSPHARNLYQELKQAIRDKGND